MPDPLAAIARLPPGLCGVVFRHDDLPNRLELAIAIASLCRRRRLMLSVAGDWRLAARLRAGVHMRGGEGPPGRGVFRTASAHDRAQLARARRAGAITFLSPVFATRSHAAGKPLGVWRWAALARLGGSGVLALGGIDGRTARRLPKRAWGAGAIGALGASRSAS